MRLREIQTFIEKHPFRPFSIRLANGARYDVNTARDIGAPKDYHVVFYFGATDFVMIDPESITEIIEKRR